MFKYLGGDEFRTVINVDYVDGLIIVHTICGKLSNSMKVEPLYIDLVNGTSNKMDGVVKPTEKLLVDAEQVPYTQVDVIKINAGEWSMFVVESLKEVINNSKPFVFVSLDPEICQNSIYNTLVNECGYINEITNTNSEYIYMHHEATMLDTELN